MVAISQEVLLSKISDYVKLYFVVLAMSVHSVYHCFDILEVVSEFSEVK